MTSRPSRTDPSRLDRSSSIPIPLRRNASSLTARNIETVLSIPISSSQPRPRQSGNHSISPTALSAFEEHRGLRGSSSSASSVRPTARSFTHTTGMPIRGSPQSRASTFEPRVVRPDSSRTSEAPCLPSPASSQRNRRLSSTGATTNHHPSSYITSENDEAPSATFPRPSYLDYSALRHIIQPDNPVLGPDHRSSLIVMSDSDDESNASPPPSRPAPSLVDQILKLPTRWSEQLRHNLLNLSIDGRELIYQGATRSGEKDAATARTALPIPPACGIYYYEVEIRSKGQNAKISVGFSGPDVRLSRLPGWEPKSWGYHGDDGCSYAAQPKGTAYGPAFGHTDIIGCGVDFTTNRAFFTKNGSLIGPVFDNVGKDTDLYPSVGLQMSQDTCFVNFGQDPFKYDIDFHVQQQRNQTWARILHAPLDPSALNRRLEGLDAEDHIPGLTKGRPANPDELTKQIMNRLVLSYLSHHGYVKTVRALQSQCPTPVKLLTSVPTAADTGDEDVDMEGVPSRPVSDPVEADIETRTKIVSSVISGDVESALQGCQTHYPEVLQAEAGLMLFKLRCQRFIELVLEAEAMKKQMTLSTEEVREDDEMDVDEEGLSSPHPFKTQPARREGSTAQYESALTQAIQYGQTLQADYKTDERPEVKSIFRRTFGIMAYDPLEVGGMVAEVVGHQARVTLANALNQAILKSQGKPTSPALEMLYRHTAVCIMALGILGSSAAFADMHKEFLDIV
ncbi:hypothetical protein C8J56DRAFT_918451 [Mycena floridula]|nr:hypothetical protein C8J56DRAFT_918451 [Mycena floridula]